MAAPIDEGAPDLTTRVVGTLTTVNLCSASRIHTYEPVAGEEIDRDYYYPTPADIHNITQAILSAAPSAGEAARNLHMLNALSYDAKPINTVIYDLLFHQAHVGHGVLRMSPSGDHGANAWVRSSGSAAHFSYVNSPVGNPSLGSFLSTTNPDATEEFDLPNLPSNAARAHEAIISAWIAFTVGTDTGLSIRLSLIDGGTINPIGSGYVECQVGGPTARPVSVKLPALDTVAATWAAVYLEVYSRRGAPGATPNPQWYLYDIELAVYYETNDIALLDAASFSALDATYASTTLDFSVWDGTFRSILLDVLKHSPELFCYVAHTGSLRLARLGDYASTPSPFDLSGHINEIVRGPYKYGERTANAIAVKWGVQIANTASGTASEDPVNQVADRGYRRMTFSDPKVIRKGLPDYKTLDRHYFRGNADPLVKAFAASHLNLWAEDVDALDLSCDWGAIEVEPGDVVQITDDELGYVARRFACVSKSLDLDEDHVLLTLFDLEYTL